MVFRMKKNNYLLKCHNFYSSRTSELKVQVKMLKESLPREQYIQHEVVKFAARLKKATFDIIPEDPNKPEYYLHGDLKGYRRYKQGLKRYRLFFTFSNTPPLILYLYINDDKHLRKEGDKNDPYEEFKRLVKRGSFSPNPHDPKLALWIHELENFSNVQI